MHSNPMNIPPLSIAVAKAALQAQFSDPVLRQRATMLWGPRGVGKSSIVRQVAQHHGVPLVDLRLFNICADAIVNSSLAPLDSLQLLRGAINLPRLLAATLDETTTDEAALLVWDVEALYRQLDDRLPPERDGKRREPQPDKADGRSAGQGGPTRPDRARAQRSGHHHLPGPRRH